MWDCRLLDLRFRRLGLPPGFDPVMTACVICGEELQRLLTECGPMRIPAAGRGGGRGGIDGAGGGGVRGNSRGSGNREGDGSRGRTERGVGNREGAAGNRAGSAGNRGVGGRTAAGGRGGAAAAAGTRRRRRNDDSDEGGGYGTQPRAQRGRTATQASTRLGSFPSTTQHPLLSSACSANACVSLLTPQWRADGGCQG